MDAAGNVYFSDVNAGGVYKVAPDGTTTTLHATAVSYGFAVDAAGNVYFSDVNAGGVFRVAPDGTTTQLPYNPPPDTKPWAIQPAP